MAYTVDWLGTREIFIPVSDMVLISGTEYQLDIDAFHKEIRRLEWEFTDGFPHDQILDHQDPVNVSNNVYAPIDVIINGYSIRFDPLATKVTSAGPNGSINNIADVQIPNGVTFIPINSRITGTALSTEQDQRLTAIEDILNVGRVIELINKIEDDNGFSLIDYWQADEDIDPGLYRLLHKLTKAPIKTKNVTPAGTVTRNITEPPP